MAMDLGQRLMSDGVLAEDTVRSAVERQLVYGGSLDTALLEMGAVDEATMWGWLARATGLPVPPPALMEHADPTAAALIDAGDPAAAPAVAVARQGQRVQILCAEPVDAEALRARAAAHGLEAELFIAPELRVHVAAQIGLGAPLPARFVRLLARLVGAQAARRWMRSPTPAPPPLPAGPIVVTAGAPTPADATPAIELPPEPPVRAPASTGSRRAMPRATDRHGEARRDRARRDTVRVAAADQTRDDDPAATVEGMAPLQQVLELAPSMAETSEAEGEETDEAGAETALAPPPAPAARRTRPGRAASATTPASAAAGATRAEPTSIKMWLAAAEAAAGDERLAALRALRASLEDPRVAALAARLRDDVGNAPGERAATAAATLGELRDPQAVPVLIRRLGEHDAALTGAARAALVEITKEDLGTSVRRWRTWWSKHQGDERFEWLFAGLSHKAAEIRYSSSEDLRLLTGQYFGYHFDLPKREREEARARWESWWLENRAKSKTTPG